MHFITRINAFRAIANRKTLVDQKPGHFLQDRDAYFFGGSRIYCRFVDYNIAFLQIPADQLAGRNQWFQIGFVVFVYRSRDCDNIDRSFVQVGFAVAKQKLFRRPECVAFRFFCVIVSGNQFVDALVINVITNNVEMFAECQSQRQAYITKADYGESTCVFWRQKHIPERFFGIFVLV
jgi:hypothetical protein